MTLVALIIARYLILGVATAVNHEQLFFDHAAVGLNPKVFVKSCPDLHVLVDACSQLRNPVLGRHVLEERDAVMALDMLFLSGIWGETGVPWLWNHMKNSLEVLDAAFYYQTGPTNLQLLV